MLTTSYYFFLGTIIASFASLVGQRTGGGQLPWFPARSYCDACHHPLAWWQLIPLAGYLIQRGHCHFCRQAISPFLPISELTSGIALSMLASSRLSVTSCYILGLATLVLISSSDYYHQVIFPIALLGLLPLLYCQPAGPSITDLVIAVALLPLGHFFSGLGPADSEFFASTTIIFGWYPTTWIILAGSLFTLVPCLLKHSKEPMPFLPGLSLATLIVMVILKQKGALA